jgi:hypothetical protein
MLRSARASGGGNSRPLGRCDSSEDSTEINLAATNHREKNVLIEAINNYSSFLAVKHLNDGPVNVRVAEYGVQSAHLINIYKLSCFCTFLYINRGNGTFPLLMRLRICSREREENMVISSIHNHWILTSVTSIDKFVISLYILIDISIQMY